MEKSVARVIVVVFLLITPLLLKTNAIEISHEMDLPKVNMENSNNYIKLKVILTKNDTILEYIYRQTKDSVSETFIKNNIVYFENNIIRNSVQEKFIVFQIGADNFLNIDTFDKMHECFFETTLMNSVSFETSYFGSGNLERCIIYLDNNRFFGCELNEEQEWLEYGRYGQNYSIEDRDGDSGIAYKVLRMADGVKCGRWYKKYLQEGKISEDSLFYDCKGVDIIK